MTAFEIAIIGAGIFFLNGLVTGVWKYREIMASAEARAHPYVDLAHRASLLYAFAAILIAVFAEVSQLGNTLEVIATLALMIYFGLAIGTYMYQGVIKQTDNQLRNAPPATAWFMWSLVAAEIGGFLVLFYGVLVAVLGN